MKKQYILFLLIVFSLNACKDKYIQVFKGNSPIYMSYEDLAQSVKQVDAKTLKNPGKMYFKDDYIFIVEELQGIHIINNNDPSNPVNQSFIEIPGAVDIAIKGDKLYADSYVDLVTLDISDLDNINELYRNEKVFPYILPPFDNDYPVAEIDEDKGVVIGWELKTVKQTMDYIHYPIIFMERDVASNFSSKAGVSSSGFGVGGSMARFGLYKEVLYVVDNNKLNIFDITDADKPEEYAEFYAGWGIETMYILDDKMFLGTQSGMRIYDISNELSPMYISEFWHVTACDPVVVKDDMAYVTLRGGSTCWNNVNELDVVSISDINNPELVERYPMTNPHGIGIDGNTLFLCDGDAGLKIYDISDPLKIDENQIAVFSNINAFDVIPINNVLLLIGDDGLYQYDYSNLNDIQFLSKIDVEDSN